MRGVDPKLGRRSVTVRCREGEQRASLRSVAWMRSSRCSSRTTRDDLSSTAGREGRRDPGVYLNRYRRWRVFQEGRMWCALPVESPPVPKPSLGPRAAVVLAARYSSRRVVSGTASSAVAPTRMSRSATTLGAIGVEADARSACDRGRPCPAPETETLLSRSICVERVDRDRTGMTCLEAESAAVCRHLRASVCHSRWCDRRKGFDRGPGPLDDSARYPSHRAFSVLLVVSWVARPGDGC